MGSGETIAVIFKALLEKAVSPEEALQALLSRYPKSMESWNALRTTSHSSARCSTSTVGPKIWRFTENTPRHWNGLVTRCLMGSGRGS